VAAQIASLLKQLQQQLGLACILIAHDLAMVANLASQLAVLEHGVLIEQGPTQALIDNPRHPHSRELIEAARTLHPGVWTA
jgi:ABC-type glutathione transport system ATPase component